MNEPKVKSAMPVEAVCAIALSLAGSVLYLMFDASEQIVGYDHDHLNNLIYLFDTARHHSDNYVFARHGTSNAVFYLLSLLPTLLFGLNRAGALFVPFLGFGMILYFGNRLAKEISGGNAMAGWYATSLLALTPFVFGLSRKFDPQTLIVGFFLLIAWQIARFQKQLSAGRAALCGACLLAGMTVPTDQTMRLLFGFFAGLTILVLLAQLALSKAVRIHRAVAYLLLAAVIGIAGLRLPLLFEEPYLASGDYYRNELDEIQRYWNDDGAAGLVHYLRDQAAEKTAEVRKELFSTRGYYEGESANFYRSKGMLGTAPGYLLDLYFSSLMPIGAMLFFAGACAFIYLAPTRSARVWALIPAVGILALSLIPKKNPWYDLEALAFLPVFSGVAMAWWMERNGKRARIAAWVCHCLLLVQYAYSLLFAPFPSNPAHVGMMDSVKPAASKIVWSSPFSYRTRIDSFAARFDDLFPGGREVRLGLLTDGYEGFSAPFLLRAAGKPIRLYPAAMSDVPELGDGLDAILLLPSPDPASAWPPKDENAFYDVYFKRVRSDPVQHDAHHLRFEDAQSRIAVWRTSKIEKLGEESWVFLPKDE